MTIGINTAFCVIICENMLLSFKFKENIILGVTDNIYVDPHFSFLQDPYDSFRLCEFVSKITYLLTTVKL